MNMDALTVYLPRFLYTFDLLWLSPGVQTSMRVMRIPITDDRKQASVQKVRYVIRRTSVTYMRLLGER